MKYSMIPMALMALAIGVSAAPAPQITPVAESSEILRRAGSLPASSGTSVLAAAQTVLPGKPFDGKMVKFDRGVSCTGQTEGGTADAVFIIEEGGTLSNVIIGPNQKEGIHCMGSCTLNNVWWSDVCEDAFTIKKQGSGSTTKIIGGGAFGASDKVFQHNGAGTLSVSDFTVSDFGKLYRSCGNCKTQYARHIILKGVSATSGKALVGMSNVLFLHTHPFLDAIH
jgi:hypothetical protein